MLLSLIFRGVAFEFRYRDAEHRTFWDHAFSYGSSARRFRSRDGARRVHRGLSDRWPPFRRQLDRLLHAVHVSDRRRARLRLCAAWRGLAHPQDRRDRSRIGRGDLGASRSSASLAAIAMVSLWTPMLQPEHREPLVLLAERRAFSRRCRLITAVIACWEWRSLNDRSEAAPVRRRGRCCSSCLISASQLACGR